MESPGKIVHINTQSGVSSTVGTETETQKDVEEEIAAGIITLSYVIIV